MRRSCVGVGVWTTCVKKGVRGRNGVRTFCNIRDELREMRNAQAQNEIEKHPIALGDVMKTYERKYEVELASNEPTIIRVDGTSFSRLARHFRRPFDKRISVAMERTAVDLLYHFSARTAYTFSDEISLFFPTGINLHSLPGELDKGHSSNTFTLPFNARYSKLVSLSAGYASARFNFHLKEAERLSPHSKPHVREIIHQGRAHFDGRVFTVPTADSARGYLNWRHRDSVRNGIRAIAFQYFHSKDLHKVSNQQVLQMMQKSGHIQQPTVNHLVELYSEQSLNGLLIKRVNILKPIESIYLEKQLKHRSNSSKKITGPNHVLRSVYMRCGLGKLYDHWEVSSTPQEQIAEFLFMRAANPAAQKDSKENQHTESTLFEELEGNYKDWHA